MWSRVFLLTCLIAAIAGENLARPKPCQVGTTYKKDCNTCTCAADAGKDKCSQIDCKRSPTTAAPSTGKRPGDCPTIVTPAPGSDVCKKRTEKSSCSADSACPQAKKCCKDGCGVSSCRNAIYRYVK